MATSQSPGLLRSLANDVLHDHQMLMLKASVAAKVGSLALDKLAARIASGLK